LVGVDPVSVALLLAVAGGMGGALGEQVWKGLGSLLARPFHRGDAARHPKSAAVVGGGEEFAALAAAPGDRAAAERLAGALAARAGADAGFRQVLETWREQAERAYPAAGSTVNHISGGTFHGPVIQGGTATGFSFGVPPAPPASGASRADDEG
jgi:hypothetical protein